MKYPIGVQTFETIVHEDYVYIDKTDLVCELTQEHICFLSRPRRFGKSLLLSTLDACFRGKEDLFRGIKMEGLEKKWDVFPVLRDRLFQRYLLSARRAGDETECHSIGLGKNMRQR